METFLDFGWKAAAVLGLLFAAYWVWLHVLSPVLGKGVSLFTVLKTDFAALVSRVENLETAVAGTTPPTATTTVVPATATVAAVTAVATQAAKKVHAAPAVAPVAVAPVSPAAPVAA